MRHVLGNLETTATNVGELCLDADLRFRGMSVFGSVPMRAKESHVAIPGSRINSNSRRKAMSEHDLLHEDTETVSELFTFGFVEFDRARNAFFVEEVKDFDPIEVYEVETFEEVIDHLDLIDTMQSEWFDPPAPCYRLDDTMLENGKFYLQGGKYHWRNDETIDIEAEDIRDRVELPAGVFGDEARFVIFTNGDDEDDVFEWGVFYPLRG